MPYLHSVLYSAALLQLACAILTGIGWYFGIRFSRLCPVLLATASLGLAILVGPDFPRLLSGNGPAWSALEYELTYGPARILTFLAMTTVLAAFAIVHRFWPEWTSDPDDGFPREERLSGWLRRQVRGGPPLLEARSDPVIESRSGRADLPDKANDTSPLPGT
jgi:hypothetical protein